MRQAYIADKTLSQRSLYKGNAFATFIIHSFIIHSFINSFIYLFFNFYFFYLFTHSFIYLIILVLNIAQF